jgi:TraM recognition site of TraD and TraG
MLGMDLSEAVFWVIGAMVIGSVGVAIRLTDQSGLDRKRKTYALTFPSPLPTEQVIAWLVAISGHMRRTGHLGFPSVVFETWVDNTGIRYRFKAPWQEAAELMEQLRSHVPGVVAVEEQDHPIHDWRYAEEFVESEPSRTLSIPNPADTANTVLTALSRLDPDERLILQLVMSPLGAVPKPTQRQGKQFIVMRRNWVLHALLGMFREDNEAVSDMRSKLDMHNYRGVVRVASWAETDARAKFLVKKMRGAFASTNRHPNYWTLGKNPPKYRLGTVERAATPLRGGLVQLSATELAALCGAPLETPYVAGLPRGRTKQLPVPHTVPQAGRIIAVSNFPGNERPIAVSVVDSCKHYHLVSRTGGGKTVLLGNLAAQDMWAGRGVIIVESKGDLFHAALNYVPKHRVQDVVVFDVSDPLWPVGFNILGQGAPEIVASEVQAIFNHIYGTEGVRMPEALYHGLMSLMTTTAGKGYTFVDLMPLMWPMSRDDTLFSDAVTRGVKDPYIRSFWQNIDNMGRLERDRYFSALRARVWQLNARAEIRHIIGQSESSFDIRDVVRGRKILLVNLAGLPEESASLIGSLVINSLWHAIKDGLSSQENPVSLFLDEFHHFVHSPISPETMLAEARSFGLSMHLAHQGLDQLNGRPQLRAAVMNNAVNKIVFQRGADDARAFAAEFGPPVKDDDLKMLAKYEVIMRVASEDGISPPITGVTRPPYNPEGHANLVRAASRGKYGRRARDVEAEIQARRRIGSDEDSTPPRIGDEDWPEGVS